ncbi:hypothetical protein [Microbacterium paludicola]|uniref:hypothetical protein n=1 Tax=Microbacterium paludicola TaxID=300019 RepID=UPI0037CA6208
MLTCRPLLVSIATPRGEPFAIPAEEISTRLSPATSREPKWSLKSAAVRASLAPFLIHSTSVSPAGITTSPGTAGQTLDEPSTG